ncbi:hypothetical protein D3C75_1277860 [compost metagenome]
MRFTSPLRVTTMLPGCGGIIPSSVRGSVSEGASSLASRGTNCSSGLRLSCGSFSIASLISLRILLMDFSRRITTCSLRKSSGVPG